MLGRVPGKRGLLGGLLGAGRPFSLENRETALLPGVPAAVPFFPALFPALSPALLGDSGFLSPVAGGPDYNLKAKNGLKRCLGEVGSCGSRRPSQLIFESESVKCRFSEKAFRIRRFMLKFRHFFDTPGREAREHLLRLFGGFGARGRGDSCVWRFPSQYMEPSCETKQVKTGQN